jgi:hypothetical protein
MSSSAFAADREHASPPLTAQEKTLCAAVLRRLHEHLHGPDADHGAALGRGRVLQIAAQVLVAAQPRDAARGADPGGHLQAAEGAERMLMELRRQGWLEDHVDPADLRPHLRLTRAGRAFAEAFAGLDEPRTPTRQRHLRATAKALAAFADHPDPDELLDACEYAARVAQDLQEDIDHFRTLIRTLAREALEQKVAWEEFSEFAARRLGAESSARPLAGAAGAAEAAERQCAQVMAALERIRALPPQALAGVDAALRGRVARLAAAPAGEGPASPVHWLVDRIEAMVQTACSAKLPQLRQELGQHVKRVTGLLRQVLALDHGARAPLMRCAARLRDGESEHRDALLDTLAGLMATSRVRLPAGSVRWRPHQAAAEPAPPPREPRVLEAALQRAEPASFALGELEILARLKRRCGGRVLRLSELPAGDVADVLVILHAVDAARSAEGRKHFDVRKLASRFHTGYFAATDYELVPRKDPIQ